MKVFIILVINMTIKLLGKAFSRRMFNPFMKAFEILVIYVIIKLLRKATGGHTESLSINVDNNMVIFCSNATALYILNTSFIL